MVNISIDLIEWSYFFLMVFIFIGIIIVAYKLTPLEYRNYSLTLIVLFSALILILFVPSQFQIFIFLGIIILLLNLLLGTIIPKFLTEEHEKLLVDKPAQIWEQFEYPPEAKEGGY